MAENVFLFFQSYLLENGIESQASVHTRRSKMELLNA